MSIEAMKQALDALENVYGKGKRFEAAITALRAAIKQAQTQGTHWDGCEAVHPACRPEQEPRRWQKLTEEEIARREKVNPIRVRIMQEAYDLADRDDSEGYNSVKVMCSEVLAMINKLLEPVCAHEVEKTKCPFCQPLEQEPVAWLHNDIEGNVITHQPSDIDRHPERWTPLYTAPRQWQGLTDKELEELSDADLGAYDLCLEVEAKLKEKNT